MAALNAHDEYRVALVGCGYISWRHLKAWEAAKGARVVAVCDSDAARAKRRAEQFGIPKVYTEFDALLENEPFDILDIATRPETHYELVAKAAASGKHIMCQKPMAPTFEEAVRIVETCEAHGVRMMSTENWRWHEWYLKAAEIVRRGSLGNVRHVGFAARKLLKIAGETDERGEPTQFYFKEMERLVIYEFGVHLIDVMRSLVGDPLSVYAQTAKVNAELAGEDVASLTFKYPGHFAEIELNWADPFYAEETLEVTGDEGKLKVTAGKELVLETSSGHKERIVYNANTADGYKLESHFRLHQHFVESLASGAPFATEGRDNLKSLEATFEAYASAKANEVRALGAARTASSV